MKGIVVLSCWVLGALQGGILILVPQMMQQGQIDALELALPLSLGTFVFVFASGKWGRLIDKRVSEDASLLVLFRIVLLGFLFSQVGFVALFSFTDLTGFMLVISLCITRILHGMFCSAIIPTAQLLLSQDDQRGEKLVWANIATNIGRLTAPLLIFVPINIDYFSLWFIAGTTACAFVMTCLIRDDGRIKHQASDKVKPQQDALSFPFFKTLFKRPKLQLLMLVCVTGWMITLFSAQLQFSLGPLLLATFNSPEQASELTAVLLFTASVSALVALFLVYKPLSKLPLLFVSTVGACLLIGTILFIQQRGLIISVALISTALSMAPAWYTAFAMRLTAHKKAQISATISQSHTLGNAFGGLLGGTLFTLGLSTLFSSFLAITVLIILGLFLLYQRSIQLHILKADCSISR